MLKSEVFRSWIGRVLLATHQALAEKAGFFLEILTKIQFVQGCFQLENGGHRCPEFRVLSRLHVLGRSEQRHRLFFGF